MGLHDLAAQLSAMEGLDRVAGPLTKLTRRLTRTQAVKDALSGTWLGHPLHPLLTDVAIGSFTSASVLDLFGRTRGQPTADALVAIGVVSALPTAAAGLSDWSDASSRDKRVGVVHAAANVVGVALYASSLLARRRGRRAVGGSLGLLGLGVMTVGGYLGGHLSYARGVGVNNAFWQHPPEDWTPVLDAAELTEGRIVNAEVNGTTVLLYRAGGGVLAIGSRCSHAGGPLDEGEVDGEAGTVTCPWHQSVFRLEDGAVVHGPATVPQVAYDVRLRDGKVEVRAR